MSNKAKQTLLWHKLTSWFRRLYKEAWNNHQGISQALGFCLQVTMFLINWFGGEQRPQWRSHNKWPILALYTSSKSFLLLTPSEKKTCHPFPCVFMLQTDYFLSILLYHKHNYITRRKGWLSWPCILVEAMAMASLFDKHRPSKFYI